MASYGYARVSTTDQDLALQREALERAGCAVIREETASGGSTAGRGELRLVLDFLRAGDELVVTRVDRLARSVGDLQDVVRELRAKGATLRCTEQPVDTGTAAGKAFLDMLGVFAEFETALRRERQAEGIARAKARGVYKGRKPAVDPAHVRRLHAEGVRPGEIARRLGVGRTTVWRALRGAEGLTTVEAAEALGVSRPTLIRLLEEGRIPHRKVGRHRRVRAEDVMAYKAATCAEREAVLDRLAAEAQAEAQGYDPA